MFRLQWLLGCFLAIPVYSQVTSVSALDTLPVTTRGHVAVGGYVDTYYGYNFNKPDDGNNPYFVSSARHNELSVNLAYVDVRYRASNLRARMAPGFGTYMDANYKNELGTLSHLVEANVGVRLWPRRNVWLDMGVLTSPFTNESAISRDHLMYTRSFAPENVPYYLSGARLTVPLGSKWTGYLWYLNGWQVIRDNNTGKSVATQIEFRPAPRWLINWNTYTGDERAFFQPDFRTRFFNDLYCIYNGSGRFSFTTSVYYGVQQRAGRSTAAWWQANAIGKMKLTDKVSLSGRVEYFDDPEAVMLANVNGGAGIRTGSAGLCVNVKVHDRALFRVEQRQFFGPDAVYVHSSKAVSGGALLVGSLTAWF
ncbi:MAG: porin [Cyclobacteriaceae bacterium]|nr:porin [Cyclobacteriaceae bacterium]